MATMYDEFTEAVLTCAKNWDPKPYAKMGVEVSNPEPNFVEVKIKGFDDDKTREYTRRFPLSDLALLVGVDTAAHVGEFMDEMLDELMIGPEDHQR